GPDLRRHVYRGQCRRRHPDPAGRRPRRPLWRHARHLRHGRPTDGQRGDLRPGRPAEPAGAADTVDERQSAGIIASDARAHSSVGTRASMTRTGEPRSAAHPSTKLAAMTCTDWTGWDAENAYKNA